MGLELLLPLCHYERRKMPENRPKSGEIWLSYGTKAMHDGDIISAPYQFVLTLGLLFLFHLWHFGLGSLLLGTRDF